MRALALLALLSGCFAPKPYMRPVPRQDEAIDIVLEVFGAQSLRRDIRPAWHEPGPDGMFETGMDVGRVRYLFKYGIMHVARRPGERFSETPFADAVGHKVCELWKLGPDPKSPTGFYRDYLHTIVWIWHPEWGAVAKANRRLEAAGL